MKRLIQVVFWLVILGTPVRAQSNLAGFWLGVTYPTDPTQFAYNYTMSITQTGTVLGGTAQTANPNLPFGGQVLIRGQLSGNTVTYIETDDNGSTAVSGLCFWRGTMTYDPVEESLKGKYENITNGTTCYTAGGGNVELYRIVLKSDSVVCSGASPALTVTGKNIRWYSSAARTTLLATGNSYRPTLTQTTTFYITQTLYKSESPAIPVTIRVSKPAITALTVTAPHCETANGQLSLTATGTAPLTYSIDGVTFQPGAVFTGLAGGTYTVRLRDAAGCEATSVASLSTGQPLTIQRVTTVATSCGQTNGQITLTTSGSGPLQYRLDSLTRQASPTFSGLAAGTYTLTVQDSQGCIVSQQSQIAPSSAPQPAALRIDTPDCGQPNGAIYLTASFPASQYALDGQSFRAAGSFTSLPAGDHTLTIRDGNQCLLTQRIQIPSGCRNQLQLPTAFSPNQDNQNDALTAYFPFASLTIARFTIYDRWGGVVYNRANFALTSGEPLWNGQIDGQPAPEGMYVCRIDGLFPDGTVLTQRSPVVLLH